MSEQGHQVRVNQHRKRVERLGHVNRPESRQQGKADLTDIEIHGIAACAFCAPWGRRPKPEESNGDTQT